MFNKNKISYAGRFGVSSLLVLAVASMAFGQIKLRTALDYDGDHRADYVVFRPSDSTWYMLRSNNTISVQPFGIANEDYPTPGDYDGDGIGDLSVWRDTNGLWYRINSATNTFSVHGWGLPGDEPVARDYDNDGKTDLAVVRKSGGVLTWYIFLIGTGVSFSTPFGLDGDFLAPGDYDGDGKFDLAVQRPGATATSPGTFYILSAQGFQSIEWGQSRDLIVPGDYDGDGKTDIAVVREGATATDVLTWNIRQSSTGNPLTFFWGLTGTDLLAQNDYDGDGKTDIAVWRNSDGKFYELNSSNQGINVWSWGLPNDMAVASYDTH